MANTTQQTGTVVGYFDRHSAAEKAVQDLKQAGFSANQVGIAARGNEYGGAERYSSGQSTRAGSGLRDDATDATSRTGSSVREAGHEAGQKAEGFWERIKSFFEGDSDETSRATSYGSEASSSGERNFSDDRSEYESEDVRHSMAGMSVPEERSKYFSHRFEQGEEGAIVTVSASGREQDAIRILQENGGDIGESAGSYDYSAQTGSAGRDTNVDRQNAGGQQRIQLLGEVLRAHTERVNRGEVRLRKNVITENQTVEVPVTREEFVIERVAASGTPAQGSIGENQDIRIPLSEERAVVDKDTVVREEVAVGKRAVQRVETVGGDVRREEVQVDQDGVENADTNDRNRKASNY